MNTPFTLTESKDQAYIYIYACHVQRVNYPFVDDCDKFCLASTGHSQWPENLNLFRCVKTWFHYFWTTYFLSSVSHYLCT